MKSTKILYPAAKAKLQMDRHPSDLLLLSGVLPFYLGEVDRDMVLSEVSHVPEQLTMPGHRMHFTLNGIQFNAIEEARKNGHLVQMYFCLGNYVKVYIVERDEENNVEKIHTYAAV